MTFVDWLSVGLNAPGSIGALVALGGQVRGRIRSRDDDPAPGDWNARADAYAAFREATLSAALNLDVLTNVGVPPRILGGVWSWPLSIAAFRRFVESMHRSLSALHHLAMVGDFSVFETAGTLGETLGRLGQEFTASKAAREPQTEHYLALRQRFDRELLDFVLAARADLQRDRSTR